MQLTDKDGNIFGSGGLEITTSDGKPKIPVINTDITIGTTAIVGGVSGRLLFDDAGVVGETAGINWNPTTSTLSLFDSPFYSQAGNSSANTAFSITGTANSNYTIYSSRQFIFNTGQSMYFNTDTDGGSALDRAWYFAGARSGLTGGRTYGALTVDSSGFPSFTLYNNDNGARILLSSNTTSYFNGGNVLIGTTTDAGYKLDVNGTARVQSGVYVDTGRLSFKTSANDYDNYIQNDGSYGMKYTVRSTNRAHQFLNTADGTKGISIVPFDSTSGIGTIATSGGAKGQLRDFVYINSGASGLSFFSDRYNGQIAYYFNTSGRNTNTTDSYLSLYNNGTNLLTILNSGNVLVGTTINIASSKLTVESTTQGFLPPRMSNAQMLAIATPATGLMVYDTTNNKLCCYDGTTWQNLF